MLVHRFIVGQAVRMKRTFGLPSSIPGAFRITGTLPERNNSPQYRLRSDAERHDRVIAEDELEVIDASPASLAKELWR